MQALDEERRAGARHFSLRDRVKAIAVLLADEFGVPFVFYNARTGEEVTAELGEGGADSPVSAQPFAPDLARIQALAAAGRAQVSAPVHGRYPMELVLYDAREPVLIATADIPALAKTGADSRREQAMLEKWLQAVGDRLRLADQLSRARQHEEAARAAHAPQAPPSTTPWEALLALDDVARRLRLDKDPDKNYQRVLDAAFGFLGARTLAWVPRNGDKTVLVQGEPCLAPADYRQLAAFLCKREDHREQQPVLYERFQEQQGAARFPNLLTVLALPLSDQGNLLGWVIALNKKGEPAPRRNGEQAAQAAQPAFRKSDAALLTPFVALLGLLERGSVRHQGLKDLLVGLTRSLTTAIDAKDSYTFGHSERVARIAVELARDMGMDGDELGDIYLAGLLHDVGKIGIRDEVLGKPGKLTPEEQEHIRQHVTIGYAILADLRQIRNLLPGVLYHHERYDGAGYPDGLVGENIPLLARILAVADSYDAMTTARPYRDPLPWTRVEEIIAEGAGTQWDKRVVDAFQRCRQKIHTIRQRGVGESLRLALDGALRTDSEARSLAAAPAVPEQATNA